MAIVEQHLNGTPKDVKVKAGDPFSVVELKLELPFLQHFAGEKESRPIDVTGLGQMVGHQVQVIMGSWQPELPLFEKTVPVEEQQGGAS